MLSNAGVELAAVDAELFGTRVKLESQRLTQRSDVARVESEYTQARLKADRDAIRSCHVPPPRN